MNRTFVAFIMAISFVLLMVDVSEAIEPKKMLAQFSTKFNNNQKNRVHNIKVVAMALHGTVLKPGQEFSFDKRVGSRTTERGYKEAGSFSNGKLTKSVGGGICQVSTTLSGSVQKMNLEVLERHKHSLQVS